MAVTPVGYQRLIERHQLPTLPLAQVAQVDTRVRGRESRTDGALDLLLFESRYAPEPTLQEDLQFALRYEGVNLEVLELLFARIEPDALSGWLTAQPESEYARRVGFLYEFLSGKQLSIPVLGSRMSYVPVLDEDLQFGLGSAGEVSTKFRVRNNLPGTRAFCPLVRKTAAILEMEEKNLRARARETLSQYDPDLIRRASRYLYLKETRSSYEVERERPSPARTQRFVDLLRTADVGRALSQERFVELQNAVVDPRWHEFAYRSRQNWVGSIHHNREVVDFVPPRPADVLPLMDGLCELSARSRDAATKSGAIDPVVHAAVIAFGFVFIHPFMDGNGRLHRFLIHEELSALDFTPKGMVLPVSAFILAHLDEYVNVLELFSKPRLLRTEFDPQQPELPARGNDPVYFRFFDATPQTLFLYRALENTVMHDLRDEINYLIGLDRARAALKDEIDWPNQSLDRFINLVRQNGGSLSRNKRRSQFEWMKDEEIERFTPMVNEAFETVEPSGSNHA